MVQVQGLPQEGEMVAVQILIFVLGHETETQWQRVGHVILISKGS